MHSKTSPSLRSAGVLISLLSCTFFVYYIWQHGFGSWLQTSTTLPSFALKPHEAGEGWHSVIQESSARIQPSVEYIDLTSKDLSPSQPYNIYPDYKTQTSSQRWHGSPQPCLGPRGVSVNSNPDMLKAWDVGSTGKRCILSCSGLETYQWQSCKPRTHVWLFCRKWTGWHPLF